MAYSSVFLIFFLTITIAHCYANKLGLDFHHRFSDKVREWTDSHGLPPVWRPDEAPRGSVEYYQRLAKYDLHRHRGRSLTDGDLYAFASGNETTVYLGHLHYTLVNLGTPNQTFLVALDTGSSLFWVPCDCKQCAPNSDPSYGKIEFANYELSDSSTNKKLSCSSDQCTSNPYSQCTNKSADCMYSIDYFYVNTSSSGILVQDNIYLIKEDLTSKTVKELPIVFGCGENQTGKLLDGLAPNGLMGLGQSNTSVPSTLANSLSISDSFSMCFGEDGSGRLNFGDKGSADQYETQLNINDNLSYNISLIEVGVGKNVTKKSFTAIIDSGVSISGFTDDIHTMLGTRFSAQVSEQPVQISEVPFKYCFKLSENQTTVLIPPVYFTTKGGSKFRALDPVVAFVDAKSKKLSAYCLGIVPNDFNIIGENFLVGQRIVFNREDQVLGWMPFDCYDSDNNGTVAPAPAPAPVPTAPVPSPPPAKPNSATSRYVSHSAIISVMTSLASITLMLHLLN